jgi:type IV secretion system protein VirB9
MAMIAINLASAAELSRTETRGTTLSRQWRNTPGIMTYGPDGKVIYLFGQSQPTIVCSPLQVCELELQAGEVVRDVLVGDTVRWKITAASSGAEDGQHIHMVIKPHAAGLETSMVITTSRRTYHIKLKSDPTQYMARIAFSYPEDGGWSGTSSFQQLNTRTGSMPGSNAGAENLSFAYEVDGDARWRPTRVYTDGIKTYIQFSAAIGSGDAPDLYVVTGGENRIVNYRVKGSVMIVDYVFDRAVLLSGVGNDQERVTIDRRG